MKKGRKIQLAFLFGTLGILFTACVDQGPLPLDQAQIELKDSLIAEGLKKAIMQQDSICEVEMDSMVNFFYDSLLQDRLLEIEKLRGGR